MDTKKLASLPREERAGRTYQRIAYRKLVDLQSAIRDCRRQGKAPLGVLDELDTENLIEHLCSVADIDYRSPAENPNYKPPVANIWDNVENLPVIELEESGVTY